MDYVNPFGIQQNNAVPTNPFWSGTIQGQTERQAQPFINNAQQSQGLDLQRKAIETGEFADPRAVRARMSGQELTAAKNESGLRNQPTLEKAERARLDEEIRSLPGVTDAKIAQAQEATRLAQTAPHREMLQDLGQLYPVLQKASEQEKPFLYLSKIEQMKAKGIKVPESLANYDPRHLGDLAALYHAQVMTPEQVGKERVVDQQGGNHLEGIAMQGANSLAVAQTSADAHIRGAQIHANNAETPAKAEARLRKEMRKDPGNEDTRRELAGYLEERFDKSFQKDGLGNMLQIQAMQDKGKMNQYLSYKEQQKARLFMNEGLYGDIDAQGRDWIMRAIESNPNSGLENVIQQGYKLGKIKPPKKK